MIYKTLLFFLLLFPPVLFAQADAAARQAAMSYSNVALSNDVFSIFNNPSGTAQYNWREIGVYYSPSPFGLSELANGYAAYSEPLSFGTVSAGFSIYGYELYRETNFVIAFSRNIANNFFIGASVVYNNLKIENYGGDAAFSFNFGGLGYITNNLRAGFSIKNLTHSTYGNQPDQIPMVFDFGLSYDVIDEFTINAAVQKEIDFKPSLRIGVEYLIIKYLALRAGFMNEPNSFSAGIGINYSLFQIDYSIFTHTDLGLTHQASVLVHFSEFESRLTSIKKFLNKL
ncbi:MAG: hypothetical protein GXO87_10355 [Chlorobi bacterium]|nr:hypothetical protein [Chlorobiota bacterium]